MWLAINRETGQETLSRLWDVLDDPHLNKAEVAAVALNENADPVRTQVAHARTLSGKPPREQLGEFEMIVLK